MLPSRRHTQSVRRWLRCKQRRAACDSSTFSPPDHISSLSHCTREAWHRVYPMSDRSEPQQQRLCTSQPLTAPRQHRVTLCNSVCVSVPGQHTAAAPCPVSARWGHSVITSKECWGWISIQNIQTVPLKMARGTVKARLEESGRGIVHGGNRSACVRHEGLSNQRQVLFPKSCRVLCEILSFVAHSFVFPRCFCVFPNCVFINVVVFRPSGVTVLLSIRLSLLPDNKKRFAPSHTTVPVGRFKCFQWQWILKKTRTNNQTVAKPLL